ncbi:hypothetical protein Tcan_11846 [Toxocara canis]|uniref:Saposin B-type domain-containing protein n=2 Tax=Toxocara canis TaxID=6265 RepID=A0A0B2VY14_TOXCA|nr:hypothetical protein Tcan_11846 [Toxocara canis]VDM38384.1 unnamed protein product [Toxocara canis]
MALKSESEIIVLWLLIFGLVGRSSAKSVLPFRERGGTMEGIVCDLCIKTMQGVIYDIGLLRNKMLEEVDRDCMTFFKTKPEQYKKCVTILREQVEQIVQRLQESLNPNNVCARLRFCDKHTVENRTRNILN